MGCLARETAFIMVFKLIKNAEKTWRRLDEKNQLPKVISGIKFSDGWEVIADDVVTAHLAKMVEADLKNAVQAYINPILKEYPI